MYDVAAEIPEPAAPAAAGAPARMAILRKTAEIGVRLAERLDRQSELAAVYAETCAVPEHLHPPYGRRLDEIARAFAPVARAIALAVALEDRIEADHRAGPEAAADRALKRELMALRVGSGRGSAASALAVDGLGAAPAAPGAAPRPAPVAPRPRLGALDLDLDRLADGDLTDLDALLRRPPEEVIAHIRSELGLAAGGPPRQTSGRPRRNARFPVANGAACDISQDARDPSPPAGKGFAPPDPGDGPGGAPSAGAARRLTPQRETKTPPREAAAFGHPVDPPQSRPLPP